MPSTSCGVRLQGEAALILASAIVAAPGGKSCKNQGCCLMPVIRASGSGCRSDCSISLHSALRCAGGACNGSCMILFRTEPRAVLGLAGTGSQRDHFPPDYIAPLFCKRVSKITHTWPLSGPKEKKQKPSTGARDHANASTERSQTTPHTAAAQLNYQLGMMHWQPVGNQLATSWQPVVNMLS
jgi:hypothetical protein